MDSGSHDAGRDPWWSGQHHQQQADGAAARLPPLGPAFQPDQQRRPNNKRGAAAASSFAASRDSNGDDDGDDDMMEEIESPEVRSFKRLKLEGGGYNNASSGASVSHDAAPQYGQRQDGNVGSGTASTGPAAAMNSHHSHAYQQQQMSHADTNLHAIHRPHPHNLHGQTHVGGRPPTVPDQHPPRHHNPHHPHRRQAAGQHTADVGENHHTSRSSHEFSPIRANPYQLQQHEPHSRPHHQQQHHRSLPPPPLPNAGVGPRCNSVTSNSTDQSAASSSGYPQYNNNNNNNGNNLHATSNGSIDSMESRSHGASYSGVNNMLGQLHAQRRMRQQQQQHQQQQQQQQHQHQTQSQAARYHPEAGHHRRNTLSPNWGLSANVTGGNGEGGAPAMGAGQHPGPVGDLHHPHHQGHQQPQGQHGQHRNHGASQSRQRVPSWRKKVQLPSSSNLY